jgi:energy-coupling factor transporter ATP-binding protein EcfA2
MTEEAQNGRPPALSLRAHDINLDGPDGVFAEDCLGRQAAVELLCGVLASTDSPAIVALNGEFGSGKSTFLKMCASVLRQRNVTVVEIDAWQQRYTGDALVDLLGALSDAVPAERERLREVIRFAGRIARGAAWSAVGQISGRMLGPDESNGANTSPIADWHKFKEARSELRKAIGEVAAAQAGRIVFIVDELDRCPPAYALDMLDRVRNVLDVPGVVVLYGITRSQLVNAIRQEQGAERGAGTYLTRFFDREIQLRTPNWLESTDLVKRQASLLPYLAEFLQARWARRWGQLPYCTAELLAGRLRDIHQFLCAADTVLWLTRGRSPVAALMLLTLKHVNRNVYDQFISGDIGGYDAAAALNLYSPNLHSENTALIPWIQAQLILCSLGTRASIPSYDEFMENFLSAGAGSADDSEAVHTALQQLYNDANNISTVTASLPYLVSIVEMSAPPG